MDGNLALVIFGALLTVPLAKHLIDRAYPYLVSNVAWGTTYEHPAWWYVLPGAGILLIYLGVRILLMRRICRITPAVILKSRV
ncbi:MAG: hypothetical protein Q4P30_05360 [Eubacteriales bacterium]|nr:hypothetical protein [Eubacteriales bacterium]